MLVAGPHVVPAQGIEGVRSTSVEDTEPRPGSPPRPDVADPSERAGRALTQSSERSGIPKTLRASGSRAGGPANDLNPGGRAEEYAPPKGDLGRVVAGKELFHGNYCGKGQRGEGLPPTDDLDAACMRHDACYDAAGYSSCACDATLEREAAVVSDSPSTSLEVRRRALTVIEAAGAMDCRAP
ncbi:MULTISPECIES: phospholipase A2 family protein [Methylobacterium]|uniref:phospholipase A2 family protein n=1 Tax=Methylobacterium TaxID=407 RepID=UPI0019D2B2AA|nr:phospholipase A2 family protein [Methylobacterium sp. DB0501]